MISSTLSKQQLLAQKSYLQARVTNYYTSNISAGDHIKFNSVVNGSGTDITLDTSTTYTSTAGVASIGRFTLKAGKTYKLYATVQGNGATGVNATFVWYNSTANAAVSGSRAYPLSPAFSGGNGPVPEATAFITTQVDTLVELRINSVTDLNTIEGADSNDATFAVIESVEKIIPVQQDVTGVAYVKDTKAQNTAGGTFTSGSWQTRVLNTLTSDSGVTWISLSSNQITLQAGTYRIYATAPAYLVDRHQIRLQNITTAMTAIWGQSNYAANTATENVSILEDTIILTSAMTFEIQHKCQTTSATQGFGVECNFGTEVYTQVKIEKVA